VKAVKRRVNGMGFGASTVQRGIIEHAAANKHKKPPNNGRKAWSSTNKVRQSFEKRIHKKPKDPIRAMRMAVEQDVHERKLNSIGETPLAKATVKYASSSQQHTQSNGTSGNPTATTSHQSMAYTSGRYGPEHWQSVELGVAPSVGDKQKHSLLSSDRTRCSPGPAYNASKSNTAVYITHTGAKFGKTKRFGGHDYFIPPSTTPPCTKYGSDYGPSTALTMKSLGSTREGVIPAWAGREKFGSDHPDAGTVETPGGVSPGPQCYHPSEESKAFLDSSIHITFAKDSRSKPPEVERAEREFIARHPKF
jgi:hypothetical protein